MKTFQIAIHPLKLGMIKDTVLRLYSLKLSDVFEAEEVALKLTKENESYSIKEL